MAAEDFILKALAAAAAVAVPLYLARRKEPLENKASAMNTEGGVLDNYNKLADRLTAYEDRMAIMRTQLDQQSDVIEKQADEINELNKASVRHGNEQDMANKESADYKSKWELALAEVQDYRASALLCIKEVRILRAIMTRNGDLTPEIEAEIQASLDAPPSVPPDEPQS